MLKSLAISILLIGSSILPAIAECGTSSWAPMKKGMTYSFAEVKIQKGLILSNWTLIGKFTTSRLKPNEVRQPYHEEGEFTVINRTCLKKIQVIEKTQDYIRVVCPR